MSKPGTFYPDGFCHGGELPDDLDLDRMIYPERPNPPKVEWKPEESYSQFQSRQEIAEEVQEHDNYMRDRAFSITLPDKTGTHTGPPRTVGDTEEK